MKKRSASKRRVGSRRSKRSRARQVSCQPRRSRDPRAYRSTSFLDATKLRSQDAARNAFQSFQTQFDEFKTKHGYEFAVCDAALIQQQFESFTQDDLEYLKRQLVNREPTERTNNDTFNSMREQLMESMHDHVAGMQEELERLKSKEDGVLKRFKKEVKACWENPDTCDVLTDRDVKDICLHLLLLCQGEFNYRAKTAVLEHLEKIASAYPSMSPASKEEFLQLLQHHTTSALQLTIRRIGSS